MSFPVARVAPNGLRPVIRRAPLPAPGPVPHTLTIGLCDVGPLFEPQTFDPQTRRILCDEGGQLYEWSAERLLPLAPHHLPRAVVSQPDRGYRPLFPEPGVPLVVHWHEFRALLASQIAHPERLREGHRVGVRVQIYEVMRPQSIDDLAESITGDRAGAAQLTLLTDRLMGLLGLTHHLPPPMRRPHQPVDGETILAHQRVVRLLLAGDPTAIAPAKVESPVQTSTPAPAVAAPHHEGAVTRPRADRESIPQGFLRPWEFKKSREDVLYAMTRRPGVLGAIRSWLSAIASRAERRLELRCWDVLRSGKSLEEQLWSVPPPCRALDDRGVRDWAARTLAHAGYDAQPMLLEWEIFWRRKLG